VQMRYRILQYIYDYAVGSATVGEPIARPLFYDFFEDVKAYNGGYVNCTFLLGKDILVAPFTSQQQPDSRTAYLPSVLIPAPTLAPTYWYPVTSNSLNIMNEEPFAALQKFPLQAPIQGGGDPITLTPVLNRWWVPFFVRAGAVIPIRPVMNYVGEKAAPITLFVFPYATGDLYYGDPYTLNLDDGLTTAYSTPAGHRTVKVTHGIARYYGGSRTESVTFETTSGTYTPAETTLTVLFLGRDNGGGSVSLNDKDITSTIKFDAASHSVSVPIPNIWTSGNKVSVSFTHN